MDSHQASWKHLIAEKRSAQLKAIPSEWLLPESVIQEAKSRPGGVVNFPKECGHLSAMELDITQNHDVVALYEKIQSGVFTAKAVTAAFCKSAVIAHQLTNCLTEIFFNQALERAEYLDNFMKIEKRPVGPLHGIPISIKDSFKIKGFDSTIGYVSFINNKATENSPLVDILLGLGAVLYVKTNVPQTLMTADSDNNIFGRVLNPNKLSLNAGGSSGGEAALIALRGSPLGVGTDAGGSIRIPAFCCGLYGFKPSANRVPYGGQQGPGKAGAPGIKATAGPLATSLRDCDYFTKVIIDCRPWTCDSSAMAFPWRNVSEVTKKLRIGVLIEDPVHPLHPPSVRSLRTAVQKLQAHGHEIVYLTSAPPAGEALQLGSHFFSLDNTKVWLKHIRDSGEPIVPSVKATMGLVNKRPEGYTVADVFDLNVQQADYIERWNKVWVENNLDVIIGPGSQQGAVPHDTYGTSPYTTMWNLMDYPGIVIPFLKADKTLDGDELVVVGSEEPPRPYSAEAVDGAPCCIQLTAPTLHDEYLVRAAAIIDKCLLS